MAIPIWPTALPQSPQKGFKESVGQNIIRSPMDAGPAKMRNRGKRPNTMDLSFILTTAQTTILENFIKNASTNVSLPGISGVGRFSFTHPRTATTVEARIVPQSEGEFYGLEYLAPGYWKTSLKFEILP
jgi:hypothetical protein